MNKNLIATLIILAVATAMIVGGTMAWFTSGDETEESTFTAGTVVLDLDESTTFGSIDIGNINPGDSFDAEWEFNNNGTKRMVYKVDLSAEWDKLTTAGAFEAGNNVKNNRFAAVTGPNNGNYTQAAINLENVSFEIYDVKDGVYKSIGVTNGGIGISAAAFTTAVTNGNVKETVVYPARPDLNEEMYLTGASINVTGGPITVVFNGNSGEEYDLNKYTLYYTGAPLLGNYDNPTPESIKMNVKVVFDGAKTHNGYQGAEFSFNGVSEAVQPTNGAPNEIWGVNYFNYLEN